MSVRVLVDRLGLGRELLVHGRDRAADGSVDVAHRLHRFDDAEGRGLREHGPDRRELDEDDVAELLLRVIGDANRGDVALDQHPLVLLRVPQ